MIPKLLTFLASVPELLKRWDNLVRSYKASLARRWGKEHQEIGEAVENASSDEERALLARKSTDLMRKPD